MIGVPLKMTLLTDRITVQKNELCLFVCVRTGWFSNLCLFVHGTGPRHRNATAVQPVLPTYRLPMVISWWGRSPGGGQTQTETH